jgi:hypothetical protein
MWSAPTPEDGVEADLVWLDDPADTASRDPAAVRGKIVFTSVDPRTVKRPLFENGAVGCLSDFQSRGADLPDAVAWINGWSDDPGGWALTGRDSFAWSFQISPRQGEKLRARLRAGEQLRGRAVVRSTIDNGILPAVTGVIRGSGKEEILLLGHQFEQGAVDNAGGIGIMLEAARALQSLVDEGALPEPRRSIRFLFVSECYTTMYWAEKSRTARRTAAGLCIDAACGMMDLAARPLEISVNPYWQPHCADALLVAIAQEVMAAAPTYPWRETPFAMGTDNMVADGLIGIPCPWIGGHSRTWHTSADRPEVLDAKAQELVARIAAAYAYLLASADRDRVLDFAHLSAARGKTRLAAAGVAELDHLADLDDSLRQIAYLSERYAEAVGSALKLLPPAERAEVRSHVRSLQREVRRTGSDEAASLARRAGRPGHSPPAQHLDCALSAIHPRRLVAGPLTFDRLRPEEREGRPSPRWSRALFAVLSWCDGRRTLAEACHLAAREIRDRRTPPLDELARMVDPEAGSMLEYFEFLRRRGYVTW